MTIELGSEEPSSFQSFLLMCGGSLSGDPNTVDHAETGCVSAA